MTMTNNELHDDTTSAPIRCGTCARWRAARERAALEAAARDEAHAARLEREREVFELSGLE